ncbi:Predicted membrane protein [Filimonas lacunae]|uniref:Predicted membrane protein n=1 Tax=Filimonas lacunae TaxID=477680 RepID=A0A173MPJ8_9BACT|nr:DUF2157 domain-containing protein [Filimonas lacunae]BAV09615.1 hypothetical protein FLA_5666 [Filimonas lacunae]SIS75953.1 Predicted membrane protein [Filimonas lacunae]
MNIPLFKRLLQNQLITEEEMTCIEKQQHKPASVHWDLLTLLYLGILLLCSGLGVVVYKNIDTIGHMAIITFIALACAACFIWCFKKAPGFSRSKVNFSHVLNDYLVLLGSLLLLVWVGYMQFAYEVFGSRWGLATFVPMLSLFGIAYYFDHLGVLSLAVTNLAAWAGITVAPLQFASNDFSNELLIYTGIALGLGLLLAMYITHKLKVKEHFSSVYQHFGIHIFLISLMAGLFHYEHWIALWFLIILLALSVCYWQAVQTKSYYLLVVTALYGYVTVSYAIVYGLLTMRDEGIILAMIYLIVSAIALILILIHYNKKFKEHASV